MYPGPFPLPDTGFESYLYAGIAACVIFAGLMVFRLTRLRRNSRGER